MARSTTVEQEKAGEVAAVGGTFEAWFGDQLPDLVRFATVLCGGPDLAEDVLQEVALKAHRSWSRVRELDHPKAYLRRMIVNEHLSWWRKWGRVIPHATLTERSSPESGFADRHADRAELLDELDKLPRRQKAVLVLRYFEGLPDSEIAGLLGCRPATVRTHASRGLAALRVELTPAATATHPTEDTRAH